MNPTVIDIIESLKSHIDRIDSDTTEPDPEELFIRTVIAELEAVRYAFVGVPGSEELEFSAANARIPGILHLYKLY